MTATSEISRNKYLSSGHIAGLGDSLLAAAERGGVRIPVLAGEEGVIGSPASTKQLLQQWRFMTGTQKAKAAATIPVKALISEPLEMSETIPKYAMFLTAVELHSRGVPIDEIARGLKARGEYDTTIELLAELSRKKSIDPMARTHFERRVLGGFLMPFYGFFADNLAMGLRTVKWAAQNPLKAAPSIAASIALPHAAMITWNNTGWRKETEESLAPFEQTYPHIITGFHDDSGRPIVIYLMQSNIKAFADALGFKDAFRTLSEVAGGRMTLAEGAEETLLELPSNIMEFWTALANPIPKSLLEAATNYNVFTQRALVPKEIPQPSKEATRRKMEHVLKQFPPYKTYNKMERDIEDYQRKWWESLIASDVRGVEMQRGKISRRHDEIQRLENESAKKFMEKVKASPRYKQAGPAERDALLRYMLNEHHQEFRKTLGDTGLPSKEEAALMSIQKMRQDKP